MWESSSSSGAVLGKDIMDAIWADMVLTELPSWVTKAPPNWGTATRGNSEQTTGELSVPSTSLSP